MHTHSPTVQVQLPFYYVAYQQQESKEKQCEYQQTRRTDGHGRMMREETNDDKEQRLLRGLRKLCVCFNDGRCSPTLGVTATQVRGWEQA